MEDRLKFYETGEAPIKNADAMQDVLNEIKELEEATASEKKKKRKKKKKKHQENGEVENEKIENGHLEEVNLKIWTSLLGIFFHLVSGHSSLVSIGWQALLIDFGFYEYCSIGETKKKASVLAAGVARSSFECH